MVARRRSCDHIHYVVQPVTTAQLERFDAVGPALQWAMFRLGEEPEEQEVAAVAVRARQLFAGA